MSLISRFFKAPALSYFLFGPRGTGKSTFLKERYPSALYIDLLDPEKERHLRSNPERLEDWIRAEPQIQVVIIDEVQKNPAVLTVVHSLIERNKKLQFILTGSSSRKLKREGVDLLGGRALNCTLHPFMISEVGADFFIPKSLEFGLLPLVFNSIDPRSTLQAYISLYLKEEVLMEGLVRNLDDFSRFLEIMSFSHGSILNISNIARECAIKRKTVEGYFSVLEDLLLGYTIPVFTKRAKRKITEHPKFFFFDVGVFRALRPVGLLDSPEEIDGAALEGLIAQHLRAWNDYTNNQHQLSFWRTQTGLEVDFVLYGPHIFCAIEVKNTAKLSLSDFKGLKAFKKDYPMAQVVLIYRGKEKIMRKEVLCIPYEDFLKNLNPSTVPFSNDFLNSLSM